MPALVANAPFNMANYIANGSLADFFDEGTVTTATATTLVLEYSDASTSERLTLNGTFGNYVDGVPTTGTITSLSYSLNGTSLFTASRAFRSLSRSSLDM